jgi:hypothetical protein
MIWHVRTGHNMTWNDTTSHFMIRHDVTWHAITWHMKWHDTTRNDMTRHDITWHNIWHVFWYHSPILLDKWGYVTDTVFLGSLCLLLQAFVVTEATPKHCLSQSHIPLYTYVLRWATYTFLHNSSTWCSSYQELAIYKLVSSCFIQNHLMCILPQVSKHLGVFNI